MEADRIKFEEFELDRRAYQLRRSGRSLKLERIPTELLFLLVEARGQLVTREEIIEKCWGKGVALDTDNAINTAIRKIRQALHDDPEQPRFIQTVTGRGYRFIAPVVDVSAPTTAPAAAGETVGANGGLADSRRSYSRKFALPMVAVLAVSVFGAGYFMRTRLFPKAAPAQGRVVLAVLPFENLSHLPDQEYFSDGLTEETITDLGQLSPEKLGVIARTSSMAYKHTNKTTGEIGHELGANYILEGSVRRDGERVRITAQLIRVKDQTHIWARSYDRQMRDSLEVQNELGGAIAGEVQISLRPGQKLEQAKTRRVNPEAYDAYLKGRYFWNRSDAGSLQKSVALFQKAIEADPGYSQAYAGLAEAYGVLLDYSVLSPAEAYQKGEAAARKAVELDSGNSEAHAALGWQKLFRERDLAGAERELRQAIELNASNVDAHDGLADWFAVHGQFDESIKQIKSARELDPLSLMENVQLGKMLFYARRYDQAIQQLQGTLDLDPNFFGAHYCLFLVHQAKGMHAEAYDEFFKQYGRRGAELAELQKTRANSGWKSALERFLAMRLDFQSRGVLVSTWDLAALNLALGKNEQTLDLLQEAADERSGEVIFLKVDPRFDSIRSAPRFRELLRRLGLPP